MPNSTNHPKLAHLSESQIEELIRRYYAGEKISGLIEHFKIDCATSNFHRYLPAELCNKLCPNCSGHMEMPRLCRSSSHRKFNPPTIRCSKCQHGWKRFCRCKFCKAGKKVNTDTHSANRPIAIPNSDIHSGNYPIKPDDLTVDQAVTLLALTKYCYSTKTSKGMLLFTAKLDKVPFAPTADFSDELLNRLIDAGLLVVVSQSAIRGESLASNLTTNRSKVFLQWRLSETYLTLLIEDLAQVSKSGNWPQHWYEQLEDFLFDLALAECLEFYAWCTNERLFPDVNEKSKTGMIKNLLDDFSVGDCCSVIYSGARFASDYFVRTACSRLNAANYMLSTCQRLANDARINNWNIRTFQRNVNCPRSIMSFVLFDTFLTIGEEGFSTPIALIKKPV